MLLYGVDSLVQVGDEALVAEDGMVGRRHNQRGLGVAMGDDRGGIGDAGGCVAPQRFAQYLPGLQAGHLLMHALHILLACDDDDMLAQADFLHALEGELQH